MMRITVKHKRRFKFKFPFYFLKPVLHLWPLASLYLPALLLYGLTTYGSPMMWYEKRPYHCTYFDVIGFIKVTKDRRTECPSYAFRKFHAPQVFKFK